MMQSTTTLDEKKNGAEAHATGRAAFEVNRLNFWYGPALTLKDIALQVPARKITAIIGPSGCGKSTFIRCFNRMNELVPGARVEGEILFHGQNL